MSAVIEVSEATFADEVLAADLPTLVDFWADWCGPCKQIAPVLAELAQTYAGRMKFVSVDTSTNMELPARLGVMALPTLMIYVNGEVVEQVQGSKPKSALVKLVEKYL